jgi:putative exosortase-associated protein (TIGR04073 family)
VGNIVVSPLEIPATMLRVGGERNAFFGFWAGGVEGIGNGLVRFSAGVLETITAPIPSDGLPLYNKRLGERALPPLRPPSGITRP